jgi:hypothetical protein
MRIAVDGRRMVRPEGLWEHSDRPGITPPLAPQVATSSQARNAARREPDDTSPNHGGDDLGPGRA